MVDVLVVVCMQKDFIGGPLGTGEAREIVPKVVDKIRGFDGIVVYTKDTHFEDYLESPEGLKLPVVHCQEGTEGWELQEDIGRLAEEARSLVLEQDGFGSQELVEYLMEIHEEEGLGFIELVGLCTDVCVVTNALATRTFLPEVEVRVDGGCCAGMTPEGHVHALAVLESCQIGL